MSIRRTAARDATRLSIFAVIAALFLWLSSWLPAAIGEPDLAAFLFRAAMVLVAAFATHLTRRVLVPDLDMGDIGKKALAHPIGAGIAFFGLCVVLSVLLVISVPQ